MANCHKNSLVCQNHKESEESTKRLKVLCCPFLLASKKTHTSMIILWKAKSSSSIRVLAFSRWPSLQYSCFALILFSIDFCGQAISSRKSTSCAFFRVFDSLVYFPGNDPILSSYQLQEIYDLGFTFRGDFWPIKKISISIVKTSERTFLIWHSNPILVLPFVLCILSYFRSGEKWWWSVRRRQMENGRNEDPKRPERPFVHQMTIRYFSTSSALRNYFSLQWTYRTAEVNWKASLGPDCICPIPRKSSPSSITVFTKVQKTLIFLLAPDNVSRNHSFSRNLNSKWDF